MALDEDERFDALMERCAVIEAQTNSPVHVVRVADLR